MKRTALAIAAPVIVFLLLYVLVVRPQRRAADAAERRAATEVSDAIAALLKTSGVGHASRFSVVGRAAGKAPLDVTFDATVEQVGRVLRGMSDLPQTLSLRSVELTAMPKSSQFMRARVVLAHRM